jgi:phosphoglycerol transferase MdoB-like AlkP superfamily enzyme
MNKPPPNPEAWAATTMRLCLRPLGVLAVFLAVFLAARLALLFLYPGDFVLLKAEELPRVFLRGLRFDLSITLWAAGLPLTAALMFAGPGGWSRRWSSLWPWICFAVLVFYGFIMAANLVYFGHVHRHFGPEVGIADDNLAETADFVLSHHFWELCAFGVGTAGLFLLWRRMLHLTPPPRASRRQRLATALPAGLLVLAGIHGGFGGEAIDITQAHVGLSPKGAILALNAPFTAITHFLKTGSHDVNYYPLPEALETVRDMLLSEAEEVSDPGFPLLRRRRDGGAGPRPNVIVIQLEGWSAESVDSVRRTQGLAPLELTPEFDRLCGEGVVFTRFFASGQRTRNALGAILAGVPALPSLPYIGKGLEQLGVSYLGRLAADQGYETFFFHPESGRDERRYAAAAATGFTHVVSRDDVPLAGDRFWDTDLYRAAAARFAAAREPFLGYIMTFTPHAPYRRPPGPWDRFPADSETHEYWNALGFADRALGDFFESARANPYFERTVFVVLSDHIERIRDNPKEPHRLFHIPCLIIAPGLAPGASSRIGGQTDVIPTLCELAGWDAAHASLGRSLFDRRAEAVAGAVCKFSDTLIRVESTGWVQHDLKRRIDAGAFTPDADLGEIERRLLALVQVSTRLTLGDRLAKRR